MNLKELKVAVLNEDLQKIQDLAGKDLEYKEDEKEELLFFINEAKKLLAKKRADLAKELNRIKKLKNLYTPQKTTFNLKG